MGWLIYTLAVAFLIKGFLKWTTGHCQSKVCLMGKTVLVTGGSSGIGYYTALGLATRGAKVIIASRSLSMQTREDIVKLTNNTRISIEVIDLASFASIRKFVNELILREKKLDILINCINVMETGNTYSEDGVNRTMAINHYGPFLLTVLLIRLLKKAPSARIIFVSSSAAFLHNVKHSCIDDLANPYRSCNEQSSVWKDIEIYVKSKLCNIAIANELALKLEHTEISVSSVNPGAVYVPFTKSFCSFLLPIIFARIVYWLTSFFYKTEEEGAQTMLHVATANEMEDIHGAFFSDCKQICQPRAAQNVILRKQIWNQAINIVKLTEDELKVLQLLP